MKQILIIEDQPEIHKLLRMTLGRDDRHISEAADGASGWQMRSCRSDRTSYLWTS